MEKVIATGSAMLSDDDHRLLVRAAEVLENPGLAARISQLVGMPIEKAMAALPGHWSSIVGRITKAALKKALDSALYTLKRRRPTVASNKVHKVLAGVSGAVGGTLGIATLALELPVSATIMLRSIGDIARSKGEDLDDLETRMACLQVFALGGGKEESADATDTAYYAARSLLAKSIGDTSKYIAAKGLTKDGAPVMVKLLNTVAARFSIPVSEKLAAQSVPVVGAIGGASLNLIFIEHFQELAEAHFDVRQLERRYGEEVVEQAYSRINEERHIDR